MPDARFTEIEVLAHDGTVGGAPARVWEIHLGEEHKDLVPLSRSGSGLRTVLLVLLNLIVMPQVEKKEPKEYVFAFEGLPEIGQYERFWHDPCGSDPPTGHAQQHGGLKSLDKVELARRVAPKLTREDLIGRVDWAERVAAIADAIRGWNQGRSAR